MYHISALSSYPNVLRKKKNMYSVQLLTGGMGQNYFLVTEIASYNVYLLE